MSKIIMFGDEGRKKILKGVNVISDVVKSTLGPRGRTVMIGKGMGSGLITKDGITCAENVVLEDPIENEGAKYVREVAHQTNLIAGDGTTTSVVLAQAMVNFGYEKLINDNLNPIGMKKGIDIAVDAVIKNLDKISKKVKTTKEIASIGTISANNDTEIGNILAKAMDKVGNKGIITIENGTGFETQLNVVEGMQFDRGYISPYFSTEESLNCVLDNAYVLLYNRPISSLNDIMEILERVSREKRSLLIIADDVNGEALSGLILNKMKGILKICAVTSPSFGEDKNALMNDIAILTGATFINDEIGKKIDMVEMKDLGQAKKIIISKDKTMIIDGVGEKDKINERIKTIQHQIDNSNHPLEKDNFKNRLAKLTGGVAVVKIGATTETEMKEKRDRAIDALNSTKSAVEEGIVAGGGVALLNCISVVNSLYEKTTDISEKAGIEIVTVALKAPFIQILRNIGYSEEDIIKNIGKIWSYNNPRMGFDAKKEEFCDMIKTGIIDPVKVTKNALKNASSIAGTLLTMDVIMVEKPIQGADMVMQKPNFGSML